MSAEQDIRDSELSDEDKTDAISMLTYIQHGAQIQHRVQPQHRIRMSPAMTIRCLRRLAQLYRSQLDETEMHYSVSLDAITQICDQDCSDAIKVKAIRGLAQAAKSDLPSYSGDIPAAEEGEGEGNEHG